MAQRKGFDVEVTKIRPGVHVRERPDEDRIMLFAELLEAGQRFPPISLAASGPPHEIIDGRTRYQAALLLDKKKIRAVFVDVSNEAELLALALQANCGGAAPPTKDDLKHTAFLLLQSGATRKAALDILASVVPRDLAVKVVDTARHRMKNSQVRDAIEGVVQRGLTVEDAARKYKVTVLSLQSAMGENFAPSNGEKTYVGRVKAAIREIASGDSHRIGKYLTEAERKFVDGLLTRKDCQGLLTYLKSLNSKRSRSLQNWSHRFASLYDRRGV